MKIRDLYFTGIATKVGWSFLATVALRVGWTISLSRSRLVDCLGKERAVALMLALCRMNGTGIHIVCTKRRIGRGGDELDSFPRVRGQNWLHVTPITQDVEMLELRLLHRTLRFFKYCRETSWI